MGPLLTQLMKLPPKVREQVVADTLTTEQAEALLFDWTEWGRESQQMPEGMWIVWLILAGRGWGKTRTGSETCHKVVDLHWPNRIRIAGVAETKKDAREVIALGESGILATAPPWRKPTYLKSEGLITWPNGSQLNLYSGEEPDQLRGPQFHYAWVDEWAKYQYPVETMDNLEMALRLGDNPRMWITTTPRPLPMIKDLLKDAIPEPGATHADVVVTRGSSYENKANLAPSYIKRVIKKYEGSRLGEQEIHAKLLDDVEGGFWTRSMLDDHRFGRRDKLPPMVRIAVACDPAMKFRQVKKLHTGAVKDDTKLAETGIMVGGKGVDGRMYLLADLSGRMPPEKWAKRLVNAYDHWQADVVVGEVNNGGDLVETNLRTQDPDYRIPFKEVNASRGKHVRAEPVSTIHQQGKIVFVGNFAQLEDQLIFYTPDGYEGPASPDRGDAFVWLAFHLMLGGSHSEYDTDEWASSSR